MGVLMSMEGPRIPALSTDLYELTMAAAYFDRDITGDATFELFIRSLPSSRRYLIAAGLEQALEYLENLRFDRKDIDYLRSQPVFRSVSGRFFDSLESLRFSGEVWAMPEGTAVFQQEPLLRIKAPIIQAQIVETALLSIVVFQTMIASKAARIVDAAQGRNVVEFGSRRAHGPEASVWTARAAYVAGCGGTSNVEAGRRFQIPIFGTMAHSFVMAHDEEMEAFENFMKVFPESSTLLVDTYDTLAAIDRIAGSGMRPSGVRLDSGDLLDLSRKVRKRLDRAGLTQTRIFASGDLDEYSITEMLAKGAQVDGFGVGASLATSKGAPSLGGVYKLVEFPSGAGEGARAKLSEGKVTYPGCKQVFRREERGKYLGDTIGICGGDPIEGRPLLQCVMRKGKRVLPHETLDQIRERAFVEVSRIPQSVRRLHHPTTYPVAFGPQLHELLGRIRARTFKTGVRAEAELESPVALRASNR